MSNIYKIASLVFALGTLAEGVSQAFPPPPPPSVPEPSSATVYIIGVVAISALVFFKRVRSSRSSA